MLDLRCFRFIARVLVPVSACCGHLSPRISESHASADNTGFTEFEAKGGDYCGVFLAHLAEKKVRLSQRRNERNGSLPFAPNSEGWIF